MNVQILEFLQIAEYTYDWESLLAPDGTLLWINRSVERITGYTPNQCYTMDNYPLPMVHSEDRGRLELFLSNLTSGSTGNDLEFRFVHTTGQTVTTALSWQSMPDSAGNHVGTRISIREISLRKSREDHTRLTGEFYRTLFHDSGDMIIIFNKFGRIIDCNRTASVTLGYNRDQLLSKNIQDITAGSDNTLPGPITNGRQGLLQTHLQCRDGMSIPVEIAVQPVNYGNSEVTALFARDITGRKKLGKDLKRSLSFSNSLLDAIPMPVFFHDLSGRYLGCNREFTRFFGISPEDIIGKDAGEIWPPTVAGYIREAEREEPNTGSPMESEILLQDKDGNEHDVLIIRNTYLDEDGNTAGIIGAILDITDRKRYENILSESEIYLRTMLNSVQTGIMLIHSETMTIHRANSRAVEMIGLREEEIVGKPCQTFMHTAKIRECPLHDTTAENRYINQNEYVYTGDGTRIPVLKTATRINILGTDYYLESFIDMTRQKELETDLRKTTKRLKEALAVKSEFISTLSHEIRTPLNSIIGHTQLLQESRLDRTQKQHVRRLEQSSRLLMDLLNGILDLSRIESGRYTVSPKVFILDDLIDKVLGSFTPAARDRNIRLHYDRGPDVPFRIESDPLCFEQILMNLLSNAIKFTADGTVVLSLRFTEESPGRFRLTVAVSDTGIGFDRTVTDRLFEPFSQADASIRRMFGGSGLGLAISSRLVSLLGGILHAESSPQEGSTFSFSLYPALPDSAFDYPYPQEVNILPKAVQLVCSDDTYTESLLSFHLTRMGFTVDTGTGLTHPVHGTDCLLVVQEDIYRLYISSPSIFRSAPPEYIILIQNGSTRTHAITAGIPLLGLPVSPQELSDILREMEDTGKHYLQESYKVSVPDSAGARCIDEEMESVKCLRQLHFNLRQDIGKAHDNLDRLIELSDEDGRKDLARIRELLSRFRIRETAAAVEEFAQKHKIYLKDI